MQTTSNRFHPFQGRAPFGLANKGMIFYCPICKFPSLSGKSSIRTNLGRRRRPSKHQSVSIPFREDLHSDIEFSVSPSDLPTYGFHPFQGTPSFGHRDRRQAGCICQLCFHPFQGRPSFGRRMAECMASSAKFGFPSLSGKTSIRTTLVAAVLRSVRSTVSIPFREDLYSDWFPKKVAVLRLQSVSIPFREDLHSDV